MARALSVELKASLLRRPKDPPVVTTRDVRANGAAAAAAFRVDLIRRRRRRRRSPQVLIVLTGTLGEFLVASARFLPEDELFRAPAHGGLVHGVEGQLLRGRARVAHGEDLVAFPVLRPQNELPGRFAAIWEDGF